jgi:acetyl esterase/lipase
MVAVALGVAIGVRLHLRPAPACERAAPRDGAGAVYHRVVVREGLHVDLFVPASAGAAAPLMLFVHERGWPAPDEREREGAAIAEALQRRGIAVAVLSYTTKDGAPRTVGEEIVASIRELAAKAPQLGIDARPVLAGDDTGATLAAALALDARYGLEASAIRGVVGLNGIYDGTTEPPAVTDRESPRAHVRGDAPPFLLLSAHGESARAAESSRAFARALERAGAKDVRAHHVSARDSRSLGNLSGDANDVGDQVAAFVKGASDPVVGGAEGPFALAQTWGAHAPLSTEPFWADEKLVIQRPTDARFRARLRNLYGEMYKDLEPYPLATYAAIDLGSWLRAHPELGDGDWLEVTNARGEQLVLTRSEIERGKPVIVIGIDDEKNLFRMFVTYNVHRTYSWKPETEPRPLLVRSVGAFLYVPTERELAPPDGSLRPVTGADFALTSTSFKVVAKDPLAGARNAPKPVRAALTNEQGCLQCHALRGEGARAHHLRAVDGALAEGFGLPLEEYPPDVLQRFLFEQKEVAKSFGVGPLELPNATARLLFTEVAR